MSTQRERIAFFHSLDLNWMSSDSDTLWCESRDLNEAMLYEKRTRSNLLANEVYHTNSLTLLVKNMLCSKLYCYKGLHLFLFSYQIPTTCGTNRGV